MLGIPIAVNLEAKEEFDPALKLISDDSISDAGSIDIEN